MLLRMPQLPLFAGEALLGSDFPLPLDLPFTAQQAAAAGIGRSVLARLVRQGYARRLVKGVYVATQVADSLVLRARALQLVVPEHTVIVDWTAVWLYTGLLPFGQHLGVPPVALFRPAGRGRLRNGLCVSGERAFVAGDLAEVEGLRVTTPLRTALDVGRLSNRDTAIVGLDGLLRTGMFSREELVASVERFRKQRGVVQLRALAPIGDGGAESPGESVLRLRWLDLPSLPRPTPQIAIVDETGWERFRLDLGVEEIRFAAEYDGEEFHSSDEQLAHDEQRRTWISREHGWLIIPVRRQNLFGPTRDIERLLYDGVSTARRDLRS